MFYIYTSTRYLMLSSLTILFLLSQNSNFFSFWKIEQKQHGLFPDDVSKVHVVHLQKKKKWTYIRIKLAWIICPSITFNHSCLKRASRNRIKVYSAQLSVTLFLDHNSSHFLQDTRNRRKEIDTSRGKHFPFNWAATPSSPPAVLKTITTVYWLCLRGSRGTRNTWTESLNHRKTPLSFPETEGLDVFISS